MKLRREEWEVVPIPMMEGKRLVEEVHYSHSHANTATYLHGLKPRAVLANTAGVAWWIPPTRTAGEALARENWQGVLSLSRLVCDPSCPPNAASFLLAGSMRLINRNRWPVLVTYADTNQGHTGAIYKATNWECDGPVPAGDVWVTPEGRLVGRKRGAFTYSAADMLARGYIKRPASPKIRFVHRIASPNWPTGHLGGAEERTRPVGHVARPIVLIALSSKPHRGPDPIKDALI